MTANPALTLTPPTPNVIPTHVSRP
jgi:hypothetical protein